MKKVCRIDKTNKHPYCLRKPCSYRLDGRCSGPVVAVKDYYSVYNCPDVPISLARRLTAASTPSVPSAGIESAMGHSSPRMDAHAVLCYT